MRIQKIWINGSRWKKRNIWSLRPLYGETKPKNKEKQTQEGKRGDNREIQTITRKNEQL